MPTSSSQKRKCQCCKDLFTWSGRNREQAFCGLPACRKASKRRSQALWLKKNPAYFRGPEHVARMKAWRAVHPGRGGRRRGQPVAPGATESPPALQDLMAAEVVPPQPVATSEKGLSIDLSPVRQGLGADGSCNKLALQDLILLQIPLVVGLISLVTGSALQETLAAQVSRLVEQGQRVLGQTGSGSGREGAFENLHST